MIGFVSGPALPRFGRPHARSRVVTCSVARESGTHELDGATISGPLRPTGHHILVEMAKAAETTMGGLILSTDAKDKPTHGKAVAVGPGKYFPAGGLIPMAVSEGDTVMFGKYGGTELKYDGEKHVLVTQDDVLCVLDGGKMEPSAVKPIHDRILVKLDKAATESKSGILLSRGGAEKPTTGTVVAAGCGRIMENGEPEPLPVSIGERVLYGQYVGTDVKFGEDDHVFIRAVDILASWDS